MKLYYSYYFLGLLITMPVIMDANNCCGEPFYIKQSNMPYTISQQGCYCLAESVSGKIIINNVTNVILDLSGKSVGKADPNIEITASENVTVRNGTVKNAISTGMTINNSTNITLENLDFINSDTGVSIVASNEISIDGCIFNSHFSQAILIQDSSLINVTNTLCDKNSGAAIIWGINSNNIDFKNVKITKSSSSIFEISSGFYMDSCNDCNYVNCSVNNNEISAGFLYAAFFVSGCFNIKFYNCFANFNTNTGTGYVIGFLADSDEVLFDSCTANTNIGNYAKGFIVENGKNQTIVNCNVSNNVANNDCVGITYQGLSGTIRNNNVSSNNGNPSTGILSVINPSGSIWGNQARGHTTNFDGIMPKVTYDSMSGTFLLYGTTTPTIPTPYDNIDVQ